MATKTTKLIRTIYLYLAVLISLIFVAVGTGNILNTLLKAYVFPEAEKAGYGICAIQPPIYEISAKQSLEKTKNSEIATQEEKEQLTALLEDYAKWKENNSGDICYKRERQNNLVNSFTMLLIALPICLFHWKVIKKDKKEKELED